ncbi:MAG: sigma-E processing peptidase SpoIIGA [Clostridium sp.]|nr:sigma-E processing peptidase SpoIIGA [Clostridium sp.]
MFLTNSMEASLYNDCEKGDEMYYELYVDSLFLINFVMNLYLLILVNQSTYRTATRLRLIMGAAAGAFFYLLPFFLSGPAKFRYLLGMLAGMASMYFVVFRIKNMRAFWFITGKFLKYSFLMGGSLLFLIRGIPVLRRFMTGIFGIMGAGAVIFLFLFYGKEKEKRREESSLCKVTLITKERRITLTALLDSGNTLMEPISKKPVSVVDEKALEYLWGKAQKGEETGIFKNAGFRVVPYHSIGKKKGILYACMLEEIRIELGGLTKTCKNVYVASSGENISSPEECGGEPVRMILNPDLLNKEVGVGTAFANFIISKTVQK